jgi:NADH-quinone oxidoreductase subunit F
MHRAPHITGYLTEHCEDDAYATLAGFRERGGYATAEQVLCRQSPQQVIDTLRESGLQGRGGAGFGTGQKWSFMPEREAERPHYLVCNADESEPGSFKDRLLMERAPHLLLEGILIAAFTIRAEKTFLYVRGEYGEAFRSLERAIEEARQGGVFGQRSLGSAFAHEVVLVRGAGAYICGEETALLESLEGKRGMPRLKPPYPAECGAFGMPTTVNNVETLCHVPHIVEKGVAWFRSFGTEESPGTTLFGVSGHIERPGLYELPLGTPLDEIVFEHAGGVPNGRKLKAVIPGGVSMAVLPAGQLDVPMTNEFLRERQTGLGTGGVIVMDDTTCMVRTACVISHFFRDESCGQCTQCREGTGWINRIVQRIERGGGRLEDLAILKDLCGTLEGQTVCAFADAAAWPVRALLRHFVQDFQSHIFEARCPFPGSFEL